MLILKMLRIMAASFCLGFLLFVSNLAAQEPDKLQLMVVTGGHSYETSFYKVFQDKPDWNWVNAHPPAYAYSRSLASRCDAILLYDMAETDIGPAARKNLWDYIESGKGVVVLHHAILNKGYGEAWYRHVVGGLGLREPAMGIPRRSTFTHDVDLEIRTVLDHPITRGLGTLHINDETYKDMWISDDVTVLMETDHPTADRPVVWVGPYQKARIVYIQLGHGPQAHLNPDFQELIRRAVLWVGGRLE